MEVVDPGIVSIPGGGIDGDTDGEAGENTVPAWLLGFEIGTDGTSVLF